MTANDPPREWCDLDVASFWESCRAWVKVRYLPDGGPLAVGIYPDAEHGIVYRWDRGPEEPPTVIRWHSPETAPPDWPDCNKEMTHG